MQSLKSARFLLFLLWPLEISLASALQYPPTASNIQPSLGPTSGGTTSTVIGFDFLEGTTVCRYGDSPAHAVGANFISSTEILCTSPFWSMLPGQVDISISNDGGGEFDAAGIRFMYLAPRE